MAVAMFVFGLARAEAVETWVAVDSFTGKIVAEQGGDVRQPIGGIAKVATAMVVLDWARLSKTDLATLVPVPNTVAGLAGNPMGLQPGDRISLRDALYSSMLGSDDAAALTLGTYVGFSILQKEGRQGVPERRFVEQMNGLAGVVGARETRFVNPHGALQQSRGAVSTAKDLARFSIYAMRNEGFVFYVKQKERTVSYVRGGRKFSFKVANSNALLGRQGINGVKNGTLVLALNAERPPLTTKNAAGEGTLQPRNLVVVVAGSPDRFARGAGLVTQGWGFYDGWQRAGMPVQDRVRELVTLPAAP